MVSLGGNRRQTALAVVLGVVLVALLLRNVALASHLRAAATGVRSLGPWAPVAFVVAYILNVLLLLPGAPLTVAAGFVFGTFEGSLVVSVASTIAAAAAFAIGRRFARERMRRRMQHDARLRRIDAAVSRDGWRVVALLRVSPLLPFTPSNVYYGSTGLRFWPFLLATWAAMLPGIVAHVALG